MCLYVENYGRENRTVNLLVEGKIESDEMKLLKYSKWQNILF